ncbi:hypothetical protein BDV25DRAFT_140630 [Aspergillus avenaceus]|uniref:Uncharacterized protein n=1 Tax=Aspergillus avenaceus TaxID=36643 RepID=A0A5N6TTG0_ASPAV|nr:hypothetical protein BDV25DRAFT_140630 [Aspergillus avenaceus]
MSSEELVPMTFPLRESQVRFDPVPEYIQSPDVLYDYPMQNAQNNEWHDYFSVPVSQGSSLQYINNQFQIRPYCCQPHSNPPCQTPMPEFVTAICTREDSSNEDEYHHSLGSEGGAHAHQDVFLVNTLAAMPEPAYTTSYDLLDTPEHQAHGIKRRREDTPEPPSSIPETKNPTCCSQHGVQHRNTPAVVVEKNPTLHEVFTKVSVDPGEALYYIFSLSLQEGDKLAFRDLVLDMYPCPARREGLTKRVLLYLSRSKAEPFENTLDFPSDSHGWPLIRCCDTECRKMQISMNNWFDYLDSGWDGLVKYGAGEEFNMKMPNGDIPERVLEEETGRDEPKMEVDGGKDRNE